MGTRPDIFDQDALIERLLAGFRERRRPVVFLLGSPLTMPFRSGGQGVAGVPEMIRNVEKALQKQLADDSSINKYQRAFLELNAYRGPDAVNELVRRSVLSACSTEEKQLLQQAKNGDQDACRRLENATECWALSPGVDYLGRIAATFTDHFGRTVLTTNFDPLISISVKRHGGACWRTTLHGDGRLGQSVGVGCHIVHTHGYWYGTDTLHTPFQLTAERPRLKSSLARLFKNTTLVAVAYGGWEDVFTLTLADLIADEGAFPEVLWAFYQKDFSQIEKQYSHLIERLRPGLGRYRVTFYGGIDCHIFFPNLWNALQSRNKSKEARRSNAVEIPHTKPRSASPFVVGPVIENDSSFFGRYQEREFLRDALTHGHSVQILGERRMGKSSLLRWIERHAHEWQRHPVAYVNAQGLGGRSPTQLVLAVARSLNDSGAVEDLSIRHAEAADTRAAEQALLSLLPCVLLLDEASVLAESGHLFDLDFLNFLRDLGQRRQLIWISSSHRDLRTLFEWTGLASSFLNDSQFVWLGNLESDAADQLLRQGLTDEDAARVIEKTGLFPYGMQWVADAVWRGLDLERAFSTFTRTLLPIFQGWIRHRTDEELDILRKCTNRLNKDKLSENAKMLVWELLDFGLIVEDGDSFIISGDAWRATVSNADAE